MSRSVPEWIGKTDDSVPPDAVKLRVYDSQGGICSCGCTRWMNLNVDKLDWDHKLALADGGENRESNLQVMFRDHHLTKTVAENVARAEARRHQAQAFTAPKKKWRSRSFPKRPDGPGEATRPIRRKSEREATP